MLSLKIAGRSVSSCMAVYNHLHANQQANLQARFTAPAQHTVTFEQMSPPNASKPKKKRPASGENVPSAGGQVLQPQLPFNFPPVNSPNDPATDPGSTASVFGGPPKKKRGRPSKVEYEAKVAEAAARGEEYHPTPKRKKAPRPSLQGAPTASMVASGMTDIGTLGEGFAGEPNAQYPKAAPQAASGLNSELTTRRFAPEATAHVTNQIRTDVRQPFKSTIPETQASEVEAQEGLLADLRESAERAAPDTVHSTMTLQHESTPQSNFTSYHGPIRVPATTGEQRAL